MPMSLKSSVARWVHRPGLAAAAVVTLALGIGGLTAIGSVVEAVLWRPLPWRAPQELLSVYLVHPSWRELPAAAALWNKSGLFWRQFVDLQSHSSTLAAVGAWRPARPTLGGDTPEAVQAMYVSASFMPMLGVTPVAGRGFDVGADTTTTDAVLMAADAAARRFGSPRQAVGAHVVLDGIGRTVVGVFPSPFLFDPDHDAPEFCLPFGPVPEAEKGTGVGVYYTVARLRSGISASQAFSEIEPIVRGTFRPADLTARVVPLADDQLASSRQPLWLLFGAAVLLFAIAILNVAALLMSDADGRRLELAVRQALGATRADLVRHLSADAAWLALAGGITGSALAAWLIPLLVSLAPATLLRGRTVTLDAAVPLGAFVLSALASLLASIWPAYAGSRRSTADLRVGARGASRPRGQQWLVAGQVALAVVLLAGVSLFSESLARLTRQPLGFDAANLTVISTRPAGQAPMSTLDSEAVASALRRLPGVTGVTGVASAPFSGGYGISMGLAVEGARGRASAEADLRVVTEDYFSTLHQPMRAGRAFGPEDAAGGHAAVVSEAFNDRYFSGTAVGRRIFADDIWWTVVGVTADVRQRSFRDAAAPALYLLDRQALSPRTATEIRQFVVRTASGVTLGASEIAAAIRRSAPGSLVMAVTPMTTMVDHSVSDERFRAELSSAFGIAAVILAAVGLFGLLSRGVVTRQREIGIRMALGARPADVMRLVVAQGAGLVAVGLAIGLPLAAGAAHVMSSLLFGVTPGAPHTFAVVAAVLALVACVATVGPARRAAAVDPLVALSND
jgi:predicted permease